MNPLQKIFGSSEARQRGSARVVLLTVGILVILAVVGIAPHLWRDRQLRANVHEAETLAPLVTVAFPTHGPATTDLVLPGSVQAIQETAIYSRVDGYLRRRRVNIGDHVQSGQVLAEIDTPELDQQVYQAKAALAQAISALQQMRASLQHTQTQLDYNRTNLDRWRSMKERNLVAQQDVDDRQVQVNAGQADVAAAQANVAAAEANVTANSANVKRLVDLQSFQNIRAPFAGVITVRNVDNGALIGAGSSTNTQPLFRLAETDSLRIFVNVPQAYVASVAPGLKTELSVREFPQRHFTAQVASLAGALDPVSRTMLTEVRMSNEGELLRPGMYADVKFQLTRKEPPLIVPAGALIFRSGLPRVATLAGSNKVRFQTVQIGRDYGSTVEVVDGLSDKDRLLIAPPDDLQDGDAVRAINARAGKD